MTDKFFHDWPTIIRRAFYEAILPLIGGSLWVLAAWWQKSSFLAALSGFGIGYLFVLSVQAQVLRIAKNVRDETDADEFRNSFSTLQQALDEIRSRGLAPPTQTIPSADLRPSHKETEPESRQADSERQFKEAYQVLSMQLPYQGVLAAAIAFETAAREVAEELAVNAKQPLSQLVRELVKGRGDEDDLAKLTSLVRARNNIVHAGSLQKDSLDEQEAKELVQSFVNGSLLMKRLLTANKISLYPASIHE